MKMSHILGSVASSAVILASALIYMTAPEAKAAAEIPTIVYVNKVIEKVVEKIVEVPVAMPPRDSIFSDADDKDRRCLALNIYFESRGESEIGQEFVAWVTLNRATSGKFSNTICGVVWEDEQFSWTHDGKSDKPKDKNAWAKAQSIANEVLDAYGVDRDPTEGATFFHANYAKPYWIAGKEKVVQIDKHIFYKDI